MRSRRALGWGLGALGFVLLVAAWWIVADTVFRVSRVVPSPPALARQIDVDGIGFYLSQIGATLASAGQGFVWGVVIALVLAALVILIPRLIAPVSQLALFLECAPAAAIGPVVLAVAGGRTPSIFLAGLAVLFTTLIGALLGARAARGVDLDVIRAYGGTRWDRFRKVQVLAALPAILNALKIAVPAAILGAIIGEFVGGVDSGIGVALAVAQRTIQVERTWIFGLSAALVTSLGYAALSVLGRVLLPWAASSRNRA